MKINLRAESNASNGNGLVATLLGAGGFQQQ